MSSWDRIETAPKDRWLLVWSKQDGIHVAAWLPMGGWYDNATDQCGDLIEIEQVTHWMPLPGGPNV